MRSHPPLIFHFVASQFARKTQKRRRPSCCCPQPKDNYNKYLIYLAYGIAHCIELRRTCRQEIVDDEEDDDDAAAAEAPAAGADGGEEERDARCAICLCRCSRRECCRTRSARVRGAEPEPNADGAPPIALRLSRASDDCGLKAVVAALCNEPPPLLPIDVEDAIEKVPNPEPCTTGGYDKGGGRYFAEAWKMGEGGDESNKIIEIGN